MAYSQSKVQSRGNATLPKADPWSKRYVSGSQSQLENSSSPSSSTLNRLNPVQKDRTLATNSGLGIGMASSVRRDLNDKSDNNRINSNSTVIDHQSENNNNINNCNSGSGSSRYSDASAPTFTSPDGVLSKVVGSLVDPENSRNKWACSDCGNVFARDTTIYVSPPSTTSSTNSNSTSNSNEKHTLDSKQQYFCKNCYTNRFSIANCSNKDCGKPILGSTKEDGKFIKVSNDILYHGKCFKCVWCSKSKFKDGIEILIGLSGDPVCESHFDKSGKKKEWVKTDYNNNNQRARISKEGDEKRIEKFERKIMNKPNDSSSGLTRSESSKRKMGNSIAELSKRFSGTISTSTSSSPPITSSNLTSPKSPTLISPTFKSQGFGLDRKSEDKTIQESLSPRGRSGTEKGPPLTNWRTKERSNSSTSLNRNNISSSPKKSNELEIKSPSSLTSANYSSKLNSNLGKSPSFERFSEKINSNSIPFSTSSSTTTLNQSNSNSNNLSRSGSFNRSGSRSPTRPRHLTAEFSSGKFKLKDYKLSSTGLERKDSRSRSVSPVKNERFDDEDGHDHDSRNERSRREIKQESIKKSLDSISFKSKEVEKEKSDDDDDDDDDIKCSICDKGPFDSPNQLENQSNEVQIVTLSGGIHLHSNCFKCSICSLIIDPKKSFVRLTSSEIKDLNLNKSSNPNENEFHLKFSHPNCSPIPKIDRPIQQQQQGFSNSLNVNGNNLSAPISRVNTGGSYTSSNGGANDHATFQRAPISKNDGLNRTPPVTLYGAPPLPPTSNSNLSSSNSMNFNSNSISKSFSKDSINEGKEKDEKNRNGSGSLSRSPSPNSRFKRPISPSKLSNTSLFSGSTNSNFNPTTMSGRKFQSTSGATPPTRSTINVRRKAFSQEDSNDNDNHDSTSFSSNPISRNPAAGFFSKLSSNPSSLDQSSTNNSSSNRFGGMSICSGCGSKLSSLESVRGPRGTSWHKSCLVCNGKPLKKENLIGYVGLKKVESICGKKLDSGAKVTVEGEVRCRECFDRERKAAV